MGRTMKRLSIMATRGTRLVSYLLLTLALAFAATACGGDDKADGSSANATGTKKATATLNEGLKAHADGDLTRATEFYNETLKLDSSNKFAYYNLALIDEARSNYGLAEQKYREALKSDPEYGPALFNLAILRTGPDPSEAISLYERALKANPKDASAWLNLGLLQRASGQKAEGDESVRKAIVLNPRLKDPAK